MLFLFAFMAIGLKLFDADFVFIFAAKGVENVELLQKGSGYLVKMNFGVGELVLVQFVMEPHRCFKGQVLAVVGGGDTTTEESLYLTKYACHVHLLVRKDQLRASKAMQDRLFRNPNITVHFNTEAVDVVSNTKGQMSGILTRKFDTGEEFVLEARGLFYGIGHLPNSQLLEGQVELDRTGYVLVDEGSAKTSVEGVFAAEMYR
ncbi:hypothetical protein GH714_034004 [Hevea brasiliensis]|uniref:FAD/NAD(P)-binding domain-containing protein n=1 Tax=Hevea brasiliensis TaxID=3981 RepID=A0A6A6M6T1_HEVBR|nr:hypothetical protein GH714_033926 [Hevea brasiliensis]KAF2307976.1 hypothetical protein GH714_034004 [Hevea brasiliensis]